MRRDDKNTTLEIARDGAVVVTLNFAPGTGLEPAISRGRAVAAGASATAAMTVGADTIEGAAKSGGDTSEAQRQERLRRVAKPSTLRFSLDEPTGELIVDGLLNGSARFKRR